MTTFPAVPALIANPMADFSDDDILQYLSYRADDILGAVISVDESAHLAFTTIDNERPSSLGRLDKLPLEVIYGCLPHLSLQTLWNLSRVSLRGKAVVESLPMYRTLAKSAGYIFSVLKQAKILDRHSITTLYAALHSQSCVSCGAYGCFLLLLSAERCCFICLEMNQSLWMISIPLAQECFGFTKKQLPRLPVMWSLPGKYCVTRSISRQKPMRLTSVRAAKKRALRLHGSLQALDTKFPLEPLNMQSAKFRGLTWCRQAPVLPLAQDPATIDDDSAPERPIDNFAGMGAVPFPSLRGGGTERGLWCRGCQFTYEKHAMGELDYSTLSRLVPEGARADEYFWRIKDRPWSKADFLQHSKHCHSAATVISQRWKGWNEAH
jgi:hypothetical protein